MGIKSDAKAIIDAAIAAVQPQAAVKAALDKLELKGRIYLVAIGKAACTMAKAACEELSIEEGIVITKYGHAQGGLDRVRVYEAGHPIPDENSVAATEQAIELAKKAGAGDTVLFLISGGGSALFEKPLVPIDELKDISAQLIACSADIVEINTVRKRLSSVKGGRFAKMCAPAEVAAIILSDIVGDPVDMIASGPACADASTCPDAKRVIEKYGIRLSQQAMALMDTDTPKRLDNVTAYVTGSVRELCRAAASAAKRMGYEAQILTDSLTCEAKEAGSMLGSIARYNSLSRSSRAFIFGGETVVRLNGAGMGGRNQELALAAAEKLSGIDGACVFAVGSDGTDGPTDAAGGYVDGHTKEKLEQKGISIQESLKNNDSYNALKAIGGLIITGPTGTNVNDLYAVLIKR